MSERTDGVPGHRNGRRRFLRALGVFGVAGLAGCGGDGDDTDEPTETTRPAGTTEPMETTDPAATTGGADTTEPSDTTEPGTDTPEAQPLGEDPAPLLDIEGSGGSLQPGGTTTISGTLTNPYLFPVRNVTVTMTPPGEDWEVSPTGTSDFESVTPQGAREVGWEVTAPEDADGQYTLDVMVGYETTTDQAEVPLAPSVNVFSIDTDVPSDGLVAYLPLDGETAINQVTNTEAPTQDATPGAEGIVGDAWEFTTNGDTGTGGDGIVTEPVPLNGEGATVGAWMNYTDFEAYSRPYHVGDRPEPPDGWNLQFDDTNPEIGFEFWSGGDSASVIQEGGDTVPVESETWLFIVAVVEGDGGRLHVFDRDGELDGSPITSSGERGQTDAEPLILMVGDDRDTAGRMDEAYGYSRALSEGEVFDLYGGSGEAA